ncbi:hypothetical protein HYT55_03705 [Candidatus Woesearchaeota archaeon]|nr:hypothetical protein [Candidatus Woesearchaeota archaeon]
MIDYVPPFTIEYRSSLTPFEPKIIESLEVLNKIPPSFLEILFQQGVRIVYFNGAVTQFPEFKDLARSKRNDIHGFNGYTWDKVAGLCVDHSGVIRAHSQNGYSIKLGDIYIGVHGDYFTKEMTIEQVTIHEIGHSVDHVVGRALFGESLSSRRNFREFKEKFEKDGFEHNANLREHFAWFFAFYYHQKARGPLSSTYYPDLERRVEEYCASRNIRP